MPKWEWVSNTGYTIDGKFYTPVELVSEFIKLKNENKSLEDVLKSIGEDGTVEHNNAIKLREENVELKGELETLELEFNLVLEINNDINKKLIGLNHLKTENVELIERIKKLEEDISKYKNGNSDWCRLYESASKDRTDLENKLDFEQKKYQILDHNYQGCTKYRDEYKHQLNAANKEIEALKSKLRDCQDKYAESFNYNDMNGLQKEIDDLTLMYKERDTKLKTYNGTLLGQIAGIKEENEKLNLQVTALHKIIEGSKSTIDEQKAEIKKLQDDIVDYVFEKTEEAKKEANQVVETLRNIKAQGFEDYDPSDFEEQKHPMYPIHWGTLDPDIYEKAKNISIEEAIKDVVKAEVENEDPFEGIPKSFPNEFQDEETTAENLEEKFDRGEDVMDYFQEPWKCPCNMCKQAREENTEKSWEEAASDLALKVAKLEKKIEELTTAK